MKKYYQPLFPSETYHLFSRAVGEEKLFKEEKNYVFFLHKLDFHTSEIADILTYTLLPNHFHLVVKIKPLETVVEYYETIKMKPFDPLVTNIPDFIMERFSNLLNSYTKSFNKMYGRKGSLFIDYLRRSRVNSEWDLRSFIFYVHKNAVHHGYTSKIGDWQHDAYRLLLSDTHTKLLREEVFSSFGGKERFVGFHRQAVIKKKQTIFIDL